LFSIVRRLVNFCWFIFKWGLLAGLFGAVIAVACLYHQVDEQIRRWVEDKLTQCYPGLKVTVRFAELVEGQGVEIRGLSILEPGAEGPRAELLHVEEVFVACPANLTELISGRLEIHRIVVRRPTLRVTRRPDGTWSVEKLLPRGVIGSRRPPLAIEDGTIEIFDPIKNPSGNLTLRNVNLASTPVEDAGNSQPGTGLRRLQGTFSGDFLRQVTIDGWIDPKGPRWAVQGSVEGLEISPEMREALPADLAPQPTALRSLRGLAKLSFRASGDLAAKSSCRLEVSGQLTRGRIDEAWLPQPLTGLSAAFRADNEGFAIENLVAYSGSSTLLVKEFSAHGFDLQGPVRLDAEVRQLELSQGLRAVLPEPLRDQWDKYAPAGPVHADVKLTYDGQTWKRRVAVEALDVSLAYYRFPYRLRNTTGSLVWHDDVVSVDLTGYSGNRPVSIRAEVLHPFSEPTLWLTAQCQNLPLDDKLLDALAAVPGKAHDVVSSLNPRGTADFFWRVAREQPGGPLKKHLLIRLNGCSMKYEEFRYPLSNITGTLEMNGTAGMHDDWWDFYDLIGANDTGRVQCHGHFGPTQHGTELLLRLSGQDVPLEQELRDALPHAKMRELWNDLRLRGMIDLDDVEIRLLAGQERPTVTFRATPQPGTTSIESVRFPYRLDDLRGTLVYRDGEVTIEGFRGRHDNVSLSATLECRFFSDGGWHLRAGGLSVDRFRLDREVVSALPDRLKRLVEELKPSGPINLSGTVDMAAGGRPGDPITSQWDLDVILWQGSVDFGVRLENLNGALKLVGAYDGRDFHSLAELDLDSLTWKDVQFTQVQGPLWVDDQQVLAGALVHPPGGHPRRPITAQLCGGTLRGSGSITLGATPRYRLQAVLTQADLARCAQDLMDGRQDLRGKVFAEIDLGGTGRSLNGMRAGGVIRLRDADIYELPLMIALLKILSIRDPNRTAFSTADIDFWIEGGHIYLTDIVIQGDAMRLDGSGLMEFDSSIRLTFRALLGPREWQLPPFMTRWLGEASEEILVIHVGGTLGNPERSPEPFPRVNEALRRIQVEMQRTAGLPPLVPRAQERFFDARRRPRIRK
jgi:hypothetical protein